MFKKFWLISLLALAFVFQSCQRNQNPLVPSSDLHQIELSLQAEKLVGVTNNFSFKLFKQIMQSKPDSNIFISPFSVSMALSMALNGANGQTFDDMRATLGFNDLSQDSINQIFDDLYDQLQNIDAKVNFSIANSIWYEQNFHVAQLFLDVTKRYFHAEVSPLNFADPSAVTTINNWVNEKTNGKIKKILNRISRDEVMFLLNALYFKASWRIEFNKKATTDAPFYPTPSTQSTCKMMQGTMGFLALYNSDFTAAQLLYGRGMFRMVLIMPQNLNAFLESFNGEQWQAILAQSQPDSGILKMPKFKFSFGLKLKDILKNMGMGIAFDPARADFSRISPNGQLFITRVDHKTYVDVNETGTVAAAVTSVGFGRTAVPQPKIVFNRPFIFVIYEKSSGAILFMGIIHHPVIEE